jgi:hypothetical protein
MLSRPIPVAGSVFVREDSPMVTRDAVAASVRLERACNMKIGQLVQSHIGSILQIAEHDPDESARLQDLAYSKSVFGLGWPFCADADNLPEHRRYWIDVYRVGDRRFRVCSQWIERHRQPFCRYLLAKGIVDETTFDNLLVGAGTGNTSPTPGVVDRKNRRFGRTEIGDAQNAFMRVILSRLGDESFDESDWEEAKAKDFGGGCAYCARQDLPLEMDHAIPINRTALGEHRLGNTVPSCKPCNNQKHRRDYRTFLGDDTLRIKCIEDYMQRKSYVPLESDQVRLILDQAAKELAAAAERYVVILNTLVA